MRYSLRTLLIAAGVIPPLIYISMWLVFFLWAMAYPFWMMLRAAIGGNT